uniref:exportin-6-like n=1 Tax=Styela clava TaxID=7725 RepID=UPI00193A167C|nr:exportin-6-like [Styela clava]
MGDDGHSLHALENIMTEFFHTSTSNHRKREIEEQLDRFGQQKGSWKHCLYFFNRTSNEYVMMYCLSVLENLTNKMWMGVDVNEKTEIRASLYRILIEKHKTVAPFIKKKLLKVIVDIGRLDWPMFYPDFFTNIISLACPPNDEETRTMGLNALRIISEEMALPREDLPHQRKKELRRFLLQQAPGILHIISDTLEKEWKKHSRVTDNDSNIFISSSPQQVNSTASDLMGLFEMGDSDSLGYSSETLPPFLPEKSHKLALEALECLCHLFSWIPLSSNISSRLLNVLFAYTRFGVHSSLITSKNFGQHSNMPNLPLGTLAMTCINELMAKNCIPNNFEDYLLRVFKFIFHFLKHVTKNENPRADLELLDEDYLEKFTEFLRLFVSVHFIRIESNSNFPLLEFLELLFKFTFNQPMFDGYYNCLDIWELFLDFLSNKLEGKAEDARMMVLAPYKEGLHLLVKLIMTQLQYQFNQNRLEELDNETLDDSGHTEWQQFVIENLEIVAKICNFFPSDTLSLLYPILEENAAIYLELGRHVLPVNQNLYVKTSDFMNSPAHNPNRQFSIPGSNDSLNRIHCALKDLSTVLQALGRLSEYFIGEHFLQRTEAMSLIDKFLTISVFGSRIKLYEMQARIPTVLYSDVIEVHVQSLATLQPFTHWLFQLYTDSQQAGHSQAKLEDIMQGYLNALIPMLSPEVPDKLVLPASHTLLSAINTIRAAFLLKSPIIDKLYSDVAGGSCGKLSIESQKLVYRSLSNLLLLPWPNTPDLEQCWDARQQNHSAFINALLKEFLSLSGRIQMVIQNKVEAKQIIIKSLHILEDLVNAVGEEIVKTRQICHVSLQSSIELCLELFPIYIDHPEVTECLMGFFLAAFRGLRSQMGHEKTVRMIQTFMKVFTPDVLEKTIMHENSAGVRAVEHFIKILELVIDESTTTFKSLTQSIITLAIDQIYPVVAQRPSPDVKEALFSLLFHILSRKNRHFFPAPVLASYLTGDKVGVLNHKKDFLAIMQAFGQSFLQPDISIFRHNLNALDNLNLKQKLYEKIYKLLADENILFQFITVLIQALVQKSHDLLKEEIYSTTWNMAEVDFDIFYNKFLPQFLRNLDGITPGQKDTLYKSFNKESDQPSFVLCLQNFVNDLRYFYLCNASLPEGTVNFN